MKATRILTIALSLLCLGACKKSYLDTEAWTTPTEENFYKTPAQAFTALVGCYDGLQIVWVGGVAFPVAAEVMSDNTFGGGGSADRFTYAMIDEFDQSRSPSDQDVYADNWVAYYKALYRCNVLLGKMDQVEWGTQTALKATYEAEARFLRAYLLFDMVRLWGNIPLLTEPSSENIPQSDPAAVYKVIADDLKFAADNLSATGYGAQSPGNFGRVTKYAAEALIGRVYLFYTGYYNAPDLAGSITKAQALAYQEDIISNGGYALLPDFSTLWPAASVANYAKERNQETVFSIRYTSTSDYNGNQDGNHWMVLMGLREQSIYPYGNGWGVGTVNPRLWNAYASNDTRRGASITSIADEALPFTSQNKQREYTGYYVKKYSPMVDETGKPMPESLYGNADFQIGQFQDYVAIRYADVLLMAAELGSANAQSYFDLVRKRAFGTGFVSKAVNKENILEERRLEFAFEGIRYYDLLRQGVTTAAQTIAQTTTVLTAGLSTTKTIAAANMISSKGFQQIPNTQITLSNHVLKQNSGW